jgi:RNA polymerase sigma-70 factor (ECF subfamily)
MIRLIVMNWDKPALNNFFRYCISLTGNEQEAFDLLQDSVEKWLVRGSTDVEYPKTYMKRIIKNTFIDNFRKKKGKEETEFDENLFSLDLENEFEQMLVNKDEVQNILKVASPDEREMLFLWAVEGKTFEEISKELEVPKGTLLARFNRLKKRVQSTDREVANES